MKLRFEIDQAYFFRKGIDAPKSIVTIEVNPAELPQNERDLIADRLVGIDVFKLADKDSDGLVKATGFFYKDLLEAIKLDESKRPLGEQRNR